MAVACRRVDCHREGAAGGRSASSSGIEFRGWGFGVYGVGMFGLRVLRFRFSVSDSGFRAWGLGYPNVNLWDTVGNF